MSIRPFHTPSRTAHTCMLPDPELHDPRTDEVVATPWNVPSAAMYMWPPHGLIWECECGAVWVAEWVPPSRRSAKWGTMGRTRWRPERRKERKRRLGLNRRTCGDCDQLATGYSTGLRGKRFHCEVHG